MKEGQFDEELKEKIRLLDEKIKAAKRLGDDKAFHSLEAEKDNFLFMLDLVADARREIHGLKAYVGYYTNGEPVRVYHAAKMDMILTKFFGEREKNNHGKP